jgi:hypothetical protein
VNVWDACPALRQLIRRYRNGAPLLPGGGPRDLFLYIEPGHVDEAAALAPTALDGTAWVRKASDLISDGFFGEVGPALTTRMADVVILPFAGESVWWYENARFSQPYLGHHGGLTRAEMEIPLGLVGY